MAAMAASSIWKGILARTGGGKAILPARAQGIPAAAVSPQRLLQRAPSRRSVLGARAPLVDERDDDQASATRARGASAKLPCMATATDGALYVPLQIMCNWQSNCHIRLSYIRNQWVQFGARELQQFEIELLDISICMVCTCTTRRLRGRLSASSYTRR